MNSHSWKISCLVIGILIVYPFLSNAGDLTLTPTLAIQGRYDNNVLFERNDVIDDYSSIIQPALFLDYKSERSEIGMGADVAFINYLDQTELDTVNQNYFINAKRRMTERLGGELRARYILDTLLDTELEETGRVFDRTDRENFYAGGGFDYRLSQKSAIGAGYDFSLIDYEEEARSDRNSHTVQAYYQRFFNEGLDSITIQPKYRHVIIIDDIVDTAGPDEEKRDVKVNTYSLNLGWTHKSSETGTIRLFLGGRYNEQDPGTDATNDEKSDSFGVVADLRYEISDVVSSFVIGYSRDVGFDADNEQREIDQLYAEYDHALTERSEAGISARFYLTRLEGDTDESEDTSFLNVEPWLSYSLTERHSLRLTYRYSLEYDDTQDNDKTVDRSQVTLAVVFKFPKKF